MTQELLNQGVYLTPDANIETYNLGDITVTYVKNKGISQKAIIGIPNVIRQQKEIYKKIPSIITLNDGLVSEVPKDKRLNISSLDNSVVEIFETLPEHVLNVLNNGQLYQDKV